MEGTVSLGKVGGWSQSRDLSLSISWSYYDFLLDQASHEGKNKHLHWANVSQKTRAPTTVSVATCTVFLFPTTCGWDSSPFQGYPNTLSIPKPGWRESLGE